MFMKRISSNRKWSKSSLQPSSLLTQLENLTHEQRGFMTLFEIPSPRGLRGKFDPPDQPFVLLPELLT